MLLMKIDSKILNKTLANRNQQHYEDRTPSSSGIYPRNAILQYTQKQTHTHTHIHVFNHTLPRILQVGEIQNIDITTLTAFGVIYDQSGKKTE